MESLTPANMKRSELPFFEGRENVTCVTSDAGIKTYLTKPIPLREIAKRHGGCKLNTIETDVKHVLFIFDNNDKEVGRYYLGKKLHGKSPEEIVKIMDILVVFDTFNPNTREWVPCVGYHTKIENTLNRLSKVGSEFNNKNITNNSNNNERTKEHQAKKDSFSDYHIKYGYSKENYERERLQEEDMNYREYGTNNPQKIEQLKEKRKQENKENRIIWVVIIVFGIIMWMLMGGAARCMGVKGDPFGDSDTEWQYKHTDRHY